MAKTRQRNPRTAMRYIKPGGEVAEDYAMQSFSLRDHPLKFLRADFTREKWMAMDGIAAKKNGDVVRIAGLVLSAD